MSGISRGTAIEIFINPHDLDITIFRESYGRFFGFSINRGPTTDFKPLIRGRIVASTRTEASRGIGTMLHMIRKTIVDEFELHENLPIRVLSPDQLYINEALVLNEILIEQVVNELNRRQSAHTWAMSTVIAV
jgi:hypothetical protein